MVLLVYLFTFCSCFCLFCLRLTARCDVDLKVSSPPEVWRTEQVWGTGLVSVVSSWTRFWFRFWWCVQIPCSQVFWVQELLVEGLGLNRSQGPVWFCFRCFFSQNFSPQVLESRQNFWPVLGLCCKPVQVQVLDESWQNPCNSSARTNETWWWSESRFWSWTAADVWVLLVWSDPTTKTDFQQQFVRFLQEEPELNGSDCNARTSRTKELLGNPIWAARCYLSRVKWADPGPETKEAPGGHRRGKTPCSPSSGPH